MRTLGLWRCALDVPSIRLRNNVLRLRRPVARGTVALRAWSVATPLAEGSVRVRGQVCLRTPVPDPPGRSQTSDPYAGRRFERRFDAAEHPFPDRPVVGHPSIAEQDERTPQGHDPHLSVGTPIRRYPTASSRTWEVRIGSDPRFIRF